MSNVAVVDASVEIPLTFKVPFDVRDDVAVIAPPVSVLMVEVMAFKTVAKKLVDVALVVDAFVAAKLLVAVALVTDSEVSPEILGT